MEGAKCHTCESSEIKNIEVKFTVCKTCDNYVIEPKHCCTFSLDDDSTDSEDENENENENEKKTPSVKRKIPTPPTKK